MSETEIPEDEGCDYCADYVPAKGYWRCPVCDAEWGALDDCEFANDTQKAVARARLTERQAERERCDIACQALIDEYVTAERERCAKIVETQKVYEIGDRQMLASAIRNPKT